MLIRLSDPIVAAIVGALIFWGGLDILFSARSALHEIEAILTIGIALTFFLAAILFYNQRKLWKAIQEIKTPEMISEKEQENPDQESSE